VIVNTTPTGSAETVVVTTPPLNLPLDFATVFVFWYVAALTGINTLTQTLRLRRGSLVTGALVNVSQNWTIAASVNSIFPGMYIDTPGAVAGLQYSVTYQGNGATGNATIGDVCLMALVL